MPLAVLVVLTAGTATTHRAPAVPSGGRRRTIFLRDCAVCHGADGTGTRRGPSLAHMGGGRARLLGFDRPNAARRSRPATGTLHPQVLAPGRSTRSSGTSTRLTGGGTAIPRIATSGADTAAGGQLFRLNCAACHAWAGDGGALPGRAAPSTHQATPTQIAEAVRTGPGRMPRVRTGRVEPAPAATTSIAYMRYLDHPDDRGGSPLGHLGPLAEGAVASSWRWGS